LICWQSLNVATFAGVTSRQKKLKMISINHNR
jgi:hypothetical protein